jgi:hypothetical protein
MSFCLYQITWTGEEKMKDNLEKKIEHETKFHDLTDEEYDRLDE